MSSIIFLLSIGPMLHVDFKQWPCCRIKIRGQDPLYLPYIGPIFILYRPYIYPISALYLPYTSQIFTLYWPCIYPISTLYLPYSSPISALYLPYICPISALFTLCWLVAGLRMYRMPILENACVAVKFRGHEPPPPSFSLVHFTPQVTWILLHTPDYM